MQANDSNISLCGKSCTGAKVSILPLRFALSITVEEFLSTAFCVVCHDNVHGKESALAV